MHQRTEPLENFDRRRISEAAERLMALPHELGRLRKQLTALRAEKRQLEGETKKRLTVIKRELADDDEYQALPNAAERKAYLDEVAMLDVNLEQMETRLQQLAVSIDKVTFEVTTAEDERKATYAVLTAYHAAVLEDLHLERELADAVHSGKVLTQA